MTSQDLATQCKRKEHNIMAARRYEPLGRWSGPTPKAVYRIMGKTRPGKRRAMFLRAYRRTGSARGCARIMGTSVSGACQVLRWAIKAEAAAFLSLCRVRN